MATRTRYLLDDLNKTYESFYKNNNQNPEDATNMSSMFSSRRKKELSQTRLSKERSLAKYHYEDLTNKTKQEQREEIWKAMQSPKKKQTWTHSHYTGNNKLPHASKTFSIIERTNCSKQIDLFPHNNTKHNTQFLDKSLQGGSMRFPRSESGEFKKPQQKLYSKHYRPIVKDKIKFNEDWELRTSMFQKTWVDHKRDRIVGMYELQANPFKTPRSNSLIAQMTKSQIY